MKRVGLLAALAVILIASPSQGQFVGPPGPFAGFKSADKEPVEIHADRMEADLSSGRLRFIGHVRAKQGERVIYAERMDVKYTEGGRITQLKARGNVKVRMGDAFATADRLDLDNTRQVIHLLGSPKVVQGKQIVIGEKMTYEIGPERLIVTRPRIEWTQEGTNQPGTGTSADKKDARP
jgi:lipopolysaccharide export system protein LptA